MSRVVASIEARMGSSRLPGKVLMDLTGQPALKRLVERLRQARRLDEIVLATTTDPRDDVLEHWARQENLACFRGSEDDVLDRVVKAHQMMQSEIVVEVTGDCPLVDPALIDWGIESYFLNACDVATNAWYTSFPMGIDIQVFSLRLLEQVAAEILDPPVREHVSLYFYEHPELYRTLHLLAPAPLRSPDWRLVLDYPEDLALIREIYQALLPEHGAFFGLSEVMNLLRRRPELLELNQACTNKPSR